MPLLDEGGQPVRERRPQATQPLTRVFNPAPAENLGTRPPAIVIRSPVRGLTPWRGPRTATLNLPKPVKLTESPRDSPSVMPSSTASTAPSSPANVVALPSAAALRRMLAIRACAYWT